MPPYFWAYVQKTLYLYVLTYVDCWSIHNTQKIDDAHQLIKKNKNEVYAHSY